MKLVDLSIFKYRNVSLDALIEGCVRGDEKLRKEFFRRYAPIIMTTCRRYEHPDFGASDILQESFLLIFKNLKRFDPHKGSIETWMKRIATNTALKVIRKRKMKFLDNEEYHFEVSEISTETYESETFPEELIIKTIKDLPEGYRTVFNLFVLDGLTHKEIGDTLDISVQTSKSQLSRAKKMLRSKLVATRVKINRIHTNN